MNTKFSAFLAALLVFCLCAACALGATANATVVAPNTEKITAPFSGTLLPFNLSSGDAVESGDTLFAYDAAPVYAPIAGTVSAVFAEVGGDAAGLSAHYGALVVIEPEHPLYIAASTQDAYDNDDNRYIHAGEKLYLKCGDNKGTGVVTQVSGKTYVVEILTGDYEVDNTIRCYRESSMPSDSDVGRGKATRYPDTCVTASGRIAEVAVTAGQKVAAGDTLLCLVDAQCAPNAPLTIASPARGAVTLLNTLSGAQVYRGQLLCEIADLGSLELSAEVDELDLARVSVGSVLPYTLDAYPGETFYGTVTKIRPIGIVRQNATYFDVRLTPDAGKTLLPGMNATVTVN